MGKSRRKQQRQYNDLKELDAIATQQGIEASIQAAAEAATTEEEQEPEVQEPETPQAQVQEPVQACKPKLQWQQESDAQFDADLNILIQRMQTLGISANDIQTFADELFQLPTREDAKKKMQQKHLDLNIVLTSVPNQANNNNPMEEKKMADNNTNTTTAQNVNTNQVAADPAVIAAALQQQQVAAAKPASGMTTVEKVVLYTAAGVAVVGVTLAIIAIAKAKSANNRINDIAAGSEL